MIKDMTKGNPSKILLYFSLPMVIGNIFQQLYNIIDSVIVGNFVGVNALAAVGSSYPITFVFITLANGLSIGCSVIISQLYGAKYIKEMKVSLYTSLISVGIFSFILMIISLIFCEDILSLLQTKREIFNEANIYMKIYFSGIVFLFIYNISTASFNALGDSRTPLILLIFSSAVNVILDLLFVTEFNMGVAGVAISTLIAQGVSGILAVVILLKRINKIEYKENGKEKIFDLKILKSMCKIAIPSTLQQSIVSIGNLFVQALVNSYGVVTIAAYSAATKIDSICTLPMANMSNAVSNFTAQNIGGQKVYRVKNGYKSALIMMGIFSLSITILVFIFGKNIIGLFVDSTSNTEIVEVGIQYLRVVSLFYFFMGLMVITNGVLRGCADIKFFLISTIGNLASRVTFAYLFAYIMGKSGIWYAIPLGWVIASIISVNRYISGNWKEKSLVK